MSSRRLGGHHCDCQDVAVVYSSGRRCVKYRRYCETVKGGGSDPSLQFVFCEVYAVQCLYRFYRPKLGTVMVWALYLQVG